ncbi:amidohydrolase [Komagataeibacter sp. AV436]|uniref:Amidohydrolase n=1 Tax=Komagataeibacter melomenusus TaxID=2766578 RepID=A0ABX2AFD6_9PROT|nr:M20 family metallopeptidase [Komagataeibacter melomenusus]MBV1829047.1 amidohydrolase [Komagataeibacter melomenusus]NPC67091.1 amidohydrolase [Komagataeibacter melomenusus]
MKNADQIWSNVDALGKDFSTFADRIWETPELAYDEYRSVDTQQDMLERSGFRITRNLAGIPTSVMGEAGEGGPVIAFLGEFDALPGLSQEAGVATCRPLPGNGNGHACGHNLLGGAAMLAATALKNWMAENGIAGTVRYYGCPAEEGGAAKTYMVREGVFKDVDFALSWHPGSMAGVFYPASLANMRIDFTFHGRSSHAAAAPHLGRSALDAAELLNIGTNYLREHMPSTARVHYAYLDAGGEAPNVVQSKVTIRYLVRADNLSEMRSLAERVRKIAQGAAMMTETRVEESVVSAVSNLLGNAPLEDTMYASLVRLGPPQFDSEDYDFAREIQKTLTPADIRSAYLAVGLPPRDDTPLCDQISPMGFVPPPFGSTDVGDVSWAVPTVQAWGATCAIGTQLHSWQMTAQGKSGIAHKGMIHVAKAMAATARDVLMDPALLERVRTYHADQLEQEPYICPLPEHVMPPIQDR